MATRKEKGSVTVDDVAAEAGVSIKTVSRVLNTEPNISEKTRAKVMAAIALLKYQPNPSARRLASKRSDLIMLVYDNPSDNYLINVQQGALDACKRYFHSLLLYPCDYRAPDLAAQIEQSARQYACAGLVLTPPLSDVRALVDVLDHSDVPYVRLAPSSPSARGMEVSTDDRSAARDMTRYLLGLGHRRIGFVAGHPDHGAAGERTQGYRDALIEQGLAYDERLVEQGLHSFDSGVRCGQSLLAHADPPTAIFAANDDMAAGVLYAAHARGIKVPENLSVAGYDDTPLSRQTWPKLTTVRQPIRDMAYAAVEQLASREPRARAWTLGYEIVVRDSTRAPA
ncbi:LacI family DNA-binding transcriptional regulator [Pandoraea pulmonicola]|uniref:Catabolite control protein n=1 Tax=Pandoraea pulmonicola TaxID=93221 RepID=A0AAJ4ZH03_PANPU|nr:LacI family DNA-binding transcriptional regulator [Pandoraea pulmonicola]AJC22567.1 LacI family transcriptional regulator [Pandoraea pulmonicola]SUA93242.1 Catabolite control protein [Pandoraea pulmonicola]